jgi:hypothetical protein
VAQSTHVSKQENRGKVAGQARTRSYGRSVAVWTDELTYIHAHIQTHTHTHTHNDSLRSSSAVPWLRSSPQSLLHVSCTCGKSNSKSAGKLIWLSRPVSHARSRPRERSLDRPRPRPGREREERENTGCQGSEHARSRSGCCTVSPALTSAVARGLLATFATHAKPTRSGPGVSKGSAADAALERCCL